MQEIPTQEKAQRGANLRDPLFVKGKLVEFAFWLKKQGYSEDMPKSRPVWLRHLIDLGADLWDPESVKTVLAQHSEWSDGYRMLLSYAYQNFLKMEGLTWTRPRYTQAQAFPFIPTEAELNQMIAASSKRKLSTFLEGLKDTGCDPGELAKLRWTDINVESRTLQIRPVKGHCPRILKVSQHFLDRLIQLPKTGSERIFNLGNLGRSYYMQRRRIADDLNNPRLMKISFRTFRHWKGTMEYHRTRDLLWVKKILGHKSIQNTLKYIDLEANIFQSTDDQFTSKVAVNVKEACTLIESGFEYVTGEYDDGGKIFRKRK